MDMPTAAASKDTLAAGQNPLLDQLPVSIKLIEEADVLAWGDAEPSMLPFALTPVQYLAFAEEDLNGKCARTDLNALHNAKRAIGCSIDSVLWNFGFSHYVKQVFPEKMQLVREMGLVSPRIIQKVLRSRNLVEHQYRTISSSEAEDAVDIATLFTMALRPFATCRYDAFDFLSVEGAVDGGFCWCFRDADGADRIASEVCDETVIRNGPSGIYFELYRPASPTDAWRGSGTFQGQKAKRIPEDVLRSERGAEDAGRGILKPANPDFFALVKQFVLAIQGQWVWSGGE
jgi:hypothetical protein